MMQYLIECLRVLVALIGVGIGMSVFLLVAYFCMAVIKEIGRRIGW